MIISSYNPNHGCFASPPIYTAPGFFERYSVCLNREKSNVLSGQRIMAVWASMAQDCPPHSQGLRHAAFRVDTHREAAGLADLRLKSSEDGRCLACDHEDGAGRGGCVHPWPHQGSCPRADRGHPHPESRGPRVATRRSHSHNAGQDNNTNQYVLANA